MNSEAAFLAAIKADPNDDLLRLAFADWLDERGRPGGDYLRIECELTRLGPEDETRSALMTQLRQAAQQMPPEWIAAVSRVDSARQRTGVRCAFCHECVPPNDYPAHRARHMELLPDGQQQDYVSLPPEERDQGSLSGVPCVYVHLGCGGQTIMQEKIIRSYLRDPFMYDDSAFCTGCGLHRPDREFVWRETGENLHGYMERLRAQASPGLAGFIRRMLRRLRYSLG